MSTILTASNQWASRPDDQRFVNLDDMLDYKLLVRQRSHGLVVPTKKLQAVPLGGDHKGLAIVGPKGHAYTPTNWSFGQLCERSKSPAAYLRTLPSELAADCVNYKLHVDRNVEDVGVLIDMNQRADGTYGDVSAITGPNYGRVWDADIIQTLRQRFGNGTDGSWRVPGEFGKRVEITKANTTLYASDRDMFVFLADEENRIEIDRRGGKGSLARGFFVSNSEVGKRTLTVTTFYFDYVCCNRIVWGVEGFQEIAIRHTSGAPDRWLDEVQPALIAYQNKATGGIKEAVKTAQDTKLKSDLDTFLANRFGRRLVEPLKTIHQVEEDRPIETYWDVATAATAYARSIPHVDKRVELESQAGEILNLVAA